MCKAYFSDTWWAEILALVLSTSCLVSIVITVAIFNHHPVPQLPSGLKLNATIAILAAGAKSSLIFAIAAAMGQSKWLWFSRKTRPLTDLQGMDDAARGPLGAATILFKQTVVSLTAIGAVIIILALAFDPFIQQIVSYPVRFSGELSSNAITRQALAIEWPTFDDQAAAIQESIFTGIFGNTNTFLRTPVCPTNNCTWAPFQSAGFCSQCEDITVMADLSAINFSIKDLADGNTTMYMNANVTLPQDAPLPLKFDVGHVDLHSSDPYWQISLSFPPMWVIQNADADNPVAYYNGNREFVNVTNPWLVLGFAYVDGTIINRPGYGTSDANASATIPFSKLISLQQCVLSPCARDFEISAIAGNLSVVVPDGCIDYGVLSTNGDYTLCWHPTASKLTDFDWIEVNLLNITKDRLAWCEYYFPRVGSWATPNLDLLATNRSFDFIYGPHFMHCSSAYTPATQAIWSSIDRAGGLDLVLPNIASALTHAVEHSTDSVGNYAVNFVKGTAITQQTIVVVRWEWLTLPVALTIISAIYLLLIIIVSRQRHLPIWKSSSLALFYHGLEDGTVNTQHSHELASEMEEAAHTTSVRLEATDPLNRLLLRNCQDTSSKEERKTERPSNPSASVFYRNESNETAQSVHT